MNATEIETAQRKARRTWMSFGTDAAMAPLTFIADSYKGFGADYAVANLSGVGYKGSMTLRVMRPIASWSDHDVQNALEALYDDLLQARASANGMGVRRGF